MNLCGISYLYLHEISHISNCIYESRMIYTPLNPSKLIRIHNDKTEGNTSLNVFIAMIPRRLARPPPPPSSAREVFSCTSHPPRRCHGHLGLYLFTHQSSISRISKWPSTPLKSDGVWWYGGATATGTGEDRPYRESGTLEGLASRQRGGFMSTSVL